MAPSNGSDKQAKKDAKSALKQEEKDRKEHEKALKKISWAIKAVGITPEAVDSVIYSDDGKDILLLTPDQMLWAKKGAFGGGKAVDQIARTSLISFEVDAGWTSTNLLFQTNGPAFGKDNKFPCGSIDGAALSALDDLTGGALFEENTQEQLMRFARGESFSGMVRQATAEATPAPEMSAAPATSVAPRPGALVPKSQEAGGSQSDSASSGLVVDPEAHLRPYEVDMQGVDASLRPDGSYGSIELGILTGTQVAERVRGMDNLPALKDENSEEDLCPVAIFFRREDDYIDMVLKGLDQWESEMPPVGVNTRFTTSEIAEWIEIAWVALKQNGRAT